MENPSAMNDFGGPVTLGASGLEVRRMGIGADAGISARALEWAFEHGINYFYWGSRRRPGMKQAIRSLALTHRDEMVIALHAQENTTIAAQAQQAALDALYGLGHDYDKTFDTRIKAVTLDDVVRVARKYLDHHVLVTTSPEDR